ncbi:MAG: LysE family translocator [Paracoccaceae bacterium]
MSCADTFSYFLTVFVLAIAPGPVVLMLIVRSASNDIRGAVGFGLGYSIGGVAIITAVCFGLSGWFTTVPELFEYSKYAMMAYIFWLAFDIWKGGVDIGQDDSGSKKKLKSPAFAGMTTCLISPYMMVLLPLTVPEVMNITQIAMPEFIILALITFGSIVLASAIVVVFAAQLRRLARSPNGQLYMNRSLSVLLVCGGGSMVML